MQLPITVVMSKTTEDLNNVVNQMMSDRKLTPDLMEYVIIKVLNRIQSDNNSALADLYISSQEKEEEKEDGTVE